MIHCNKHMGQAIWLVYIMSKATWKRRFSILSEPFLWTQGSWRRTIIWLVILFLSIIMVDCLQWIFILYFHVFHSIKTSVSDIKKKKIKTSVSSCYLKGNALKDSGRVEEAIQCYHVGSFYPSFSSLLLVVISCLLYDLIILTLFSEAMSCSAT